MAESGAESVAGSIFFCLSGRTLFTLPFEIKYDDAYLNGHGPLLAPPGKVDERGVSDNQSMSGDTDRNNEDGQTGVIVRSRTKTKKPAMYKVLMLNDDYTPMEFVVLVLERFFAKNREEATRIMLHVHQRGVGICGVYTYEVAETKVTQTMEFARKHQHPLQCTLEKD